MQEIIRTLSWTFIHSLWQGLLAALLAAIIISSTRRAAAKLRYCLLSIVMILFLTASVITFIEQWHIEVATVIAYAGFTIPSDVAVINGSSVMDNIINWVNRNSGLLVLAWVCFFLLHCLRLITGLAAINRLRHYRTHPIPGEWNSKLTQLKLMIGIRRSVILLQSELVKVPTALGFLKPVILLPLGLLAHLPPEQVETILLHELAHIRRKDYLINLLQHIAEAIFFFNPALRWLSSLIRQEREACCDDIVIANCKQKAKYLEALINFQEYSLSQTSYALRISSRRYYLLNRVKRIITNKNKGIGFIEKIALLGGVFLFSAFSFVTKEKAKEIKQMPAVIQQELPTTNSQTAQGKPGPPAIKKEKKKINSVNVQQPVTDTVPRKKDTVIKNEQMPVKKPPEKIKEPQKPITDAAEALQEIVKIKVQIGLKKESIGTKKEQLKTADEKEKERILKEIDRERDELEEQRDELEQKREKWQELKKEAQNKPKVQESVREKTVIDKDKPAAVQKINNLSIAPAKEIHAKTDLKVKNSKSHDIKIDKQEYQYKIQQGISPPRVESKAAPQKIKSPAAPTKKVRQS